MRAEARTANGGAIQPWHRKQRPNRAKHCQHAAKLRFNNHNARKWNANIKGDRAQDRIKGQEVPLRHDMRRRDQRVKFNIVISMAQIVGRKKHKARIDDQKHHQPKRILIGIIRVERQRVFLRLHIDAQRVVRPCDMQRPDMQKHNADNQEGE